MIYMGVGKSVLASLIIEESRRLCKDRPMSVVFFYCKYQDSNRDNFVAVVRGMLVQILGQNGSLLPYFYEKASISGESVLESLVLARELLEVSLKSLGTVYVIIDGLDECDKSEQKQIITWFRSIIESRSEADSESIRCLFFSQDNGVVGKLLSKTPVIRINPKDTKEDIQRYNALWSVKIQEKFGLPDLTRENIALKVTEAADGKLTFHRNPIGG